MHVNYSPHKIGSIDASVFFFSANQVRKIPTFTNSVTFCVAERNVTHMLIIQDRNCRHVLRGAKSLNEMKYLYDVNTNGLFIFLTLASDRILGLFLAYQFHLPLFFLKYTVRQYFSFQTRFLVIRSFLKRHISS